MLKDRIRALVGWLKSTLVPGGSLMEQSVTGGIWSTLLNVSSRVLQLLTFVILARFLPPEAFGILGVAMLVIVALRRMSKLGLDEALIYNKNENVDEYLNTAWVLNVVRGTVIAALLFLGAPYIADFFSEPMAQDVLALMAVGPLVFALKSPAVVYFRKDLDFHKEFTYRVSGDFVYFLVAVVYSLFDPTVWALAAAYVSRTIVRTIVSYVIHDYRPWPSFDIDRAKEMIDYGKWITASNITNYIRNEGDDVFVGWLLSSASLGFYQMAYRLSNAPATEVSHVIARVSFPAYSSVQDDKAKLRTGFFKTIRVASFLVAPMAVGIAVVAPTFVRAVLGEAWLPMVFPMQILAVYGMMRGFASSYGAVWRATGNQDYLVKVSIVSIVLMAIPIYPATARFGITGASAVIAGVYVLFMFPLDTYLAANAINASSLRVLSEFIYPLVPTALMGGIVFWTQQTVDFLPVMVELVLLIAVGVVSYAGLTLLIDRPIQWGIRDELHDIREAL